LGERAPPDIGQLAEGGLATSRSLHEFLGDHLAARMIATVRKLAANLVNHGVHIGFGMLVKFVHDSTLPQNIASSWTVLGRVKSNYHFFPNIGTRDRRGG
jgi:hypothetical protein